MNRNNVVLILFSSLCLQACTDDPNLNPTPFNSPTISGVDQELQSYFISFQQEAVKRGFDYDLNTLDVSGDIDQISDEGVAGTCQYGSHITNHITIDQDFWDSAPPIYREFVVYHELGHCVLLRGHDESTDASGRCLSIMRSGLQGCIDSYSPLSKSDFLDELFFEQD